MTDRDNLPDQSPAAATSACSFAAIAAKAFAGPSDAAAHADNSIDRAELTPEDAPRVKLPARSTCLTCPNHTLRNSDLPWAPPPGTFDFLVESKIEDGMRPPPPPWAWKGIDQTQSICDFRRPSLDVLARVIDPARLSEGLFVNRIMPDCFCTTMLHDAADHDFPHGMRLDDLRQEAELARRRNLPAPAKPPRVDEKCPSGLPPWPHVSGQMLRMKMFKVDDRPNVTPDPALARRQKKSKVPRPAPSADLFGAFGVRKRNK